MELFKRFLRFVRPYRWQIAQVMVLLLVVSGIGLWRPKIFQFILDDALGAKALGKAGVEAEPSVAKLWIGVGLMLLNTALMAGIGYWRSWKITVVGQRIIFDIRRHLHKHLQRLSMSYFESHQTGRILSRVMYDVDAIGSLASGTLVMLLSDIVTIIFLIFYMFYLNWQMTLIAVLIIPLYIINFTMLRKSIQRAYRRVREKVSEISGNLHEKLAATKVVKSFTRERSESRIFIHQIRENLGLSLQSARLSMWLGRSAAILTGIGTAAIYLVGGYFVITGQEDFTVGKLVQFNSYLGMLYGPVERLIQSNDVITRALVALERIFEVFDTRPEVEDKPDALNLDHIDGRVEFKNVNFGYIPDELVLQNINLMVEPGEMVAFVGPSGSGKTTLANLIARFYDPTTGDIFLDGNNLKDIRLRSLRHSIGMVLQETHLFTGTIRDNVRYGNRQATNEEIVRAAMAANAHDFIMELPEDYDTELGERGLKLSGGQRQRVAIARAILRDPRLLILDEATSALDSTSEALIQAALDRLMEGRTSFVIAHRLSTIMKANKIVVLENGIIVDIGSHDELLERGGLYAKLYNMQFRKQEMEEEEEEAAKATPRATVATPGRDRSGGGMRS
ncbi:MAG: ABC transporter ATP-binding protein [Armatimonadetes bacterium]|nr:ABC transporter ATP-binding protein [Armatimonadota bacterium]